MRPVLLRQGVLGIKGQSMLPWDPTGKTGPKKPLPDDVSIVEAKDETLPTTLVSKQKSGKPEPLACPSWYPQQNRSSWPLDLEFGCCSIKMFNKKFFKENK